MVSDEGGVSKGHTTFVTSKAGTTKEVVFHEGDLSKGVLYILYIFGDGQNKTKFIFIGEGGGGGKNILDPPLG